MLCFDLAAPWVVAQTRRWRRNAHSHRAEAFEPTAFRCPSPRTLGVTKGRPTVIGALALLAQQPRHWRGLPLKCLMQHRQAHRAIPLRGRQHDAGGRGLEDSSNRCRFGPLYRSCCNAAQGHGPRRATVGGSSQPGAAPVRRRGRALTRNATSIAQCAASHTAPSRGFHAPGRCVRITKAQAAHAS